MVEEAGCDGAASGFDGSDGRGRGAGDGDVDGDIEGGCTLFVGVSMGWLRLVGGVVYVGGILGREA